MADALASGASDRKIVGVQVPPRPPRCWVSNQMKRAPTDKVTPVRSWLLAVCLVTLLSSCADDPGTGQEQTTSTLAAPLSTSTTTLMATLTSTSTSTTTLPPVQIFGEFDDVVEAAALGPLPEDFPLGRAAASSSPLYENRCHASTSAIDPVGCEFGDLDSNVVIVFTGDSHAAQWFGAFEVAARTNHWRLIAMTKSSCPVADVPTYRRRDALPDGEELLYPECNEFHTRTHSRIRELQPDLVIFPVLSRYHLVNNGGIAAFSAGLGDSISAIAGLGTKVLVLGETPKTNGEDIPSCLARHKNDIAICANMRSRAESPQRVKYLSETAAEHSATYVNPVDWFCTIDVCPGEIGGRIVYRDYNHISDQFARYRAPQIGEAIKVALRGPDAT